MERAFQIIVLLIAWDCLHAKTGSEVPLKSELLAFII